MSTGITTPPSPSLPNTNLAQTLQALSQALLALGHDVPSPDPRLDELITTLPRLTEEDVDMDAVCPICLVAFRAHLAEEELASVMESPANDEADLGVTRLQDTCKHVFCRKDISTWIRQSRNTACPTCRTPLLPPVPPTQPSSSLNPSDPLEPSPTSAPRTAPPNPTDSTDSSESDPQAPFRMVDQVIREVLESLRPTDGSDGTSQLEDMRRMMEQLLPTLSPLLRNVTLADAESGGTGIGMGIGGIRTTEETEEDRDYPSRSEFDMYS